MKLIYSTSLVNSKIDMEAQGASGKSLFFYKNNHVGGLVLLDMKTY